MPNFPKNDISYTLIGTRTCAYQGVRNVCFSENLACFVFFEIPILRFARLPYYRRTVLTILTMAGFWVCLFKVSQGCEYASDSKYARARNVPRLWIGHGHKECWICLNKPEYTLAMPQCAWICLNNAEYAWIHLNK